MFVQWHDSASDTQAIPDEDIARMQRKVVEVYEMFFASLGSQVLTALEQVRIEQFLTESDRGEAIAKLNSQGLPSKVSEYCITCLKHFIIAISLFMFITQKSIKCR